MQTIRLAQVASTIRSKNAGPDCITFDIIFREPDVYERVKASGALTAERILELYGIGPDRLVHFGAFDPARAFKFSIRRLQPSGSPGETDVMGSQAYAPLLDLQLPASVLSASGPAT